MSSGGGERVYRRIAELLVDRGIEVDYVTRKLWKSDEPPRAPFSTVVAADTEIYNSDGRRTVAGAISFAFGVFRYLRRTRGTYEIVIASALPSLTLIAASMALVGSRSYLVADWLEVWSWSKWCRYSGLLAGSIAFVMQCGAVRLGSLQTVNSSFSAAAIRRYRRHADPLVLGLVDLANNAGAWGMADTAIKPPYVLFVGRHIADKRIDVLPGALAEARRSIPDLRLVVAGSGPETNSLQAEIERLGLEDACDLVGWVDEDRLHALLASASALVNPSEREGFGLVIAEAARVGTPSVVVAGIANAAVDLVSDGENGTIAASVEPTVLGAAIAKVVSAGPRLRTTTSEWFTVQRKEHNLTESVETILACYSSARSKD